jgi:pimeloyl-ACP methyl ester carboxylesterase
MQEGSMLRLLTIAVVAMLVSTSADAADPCDDKRAGYIRPHYDDSDTVVIFVHGLGGNPWETWKHPEATESWPCMLRGDGPLEKANVYLYGYDTGIGGERPRIADVAAGAKRDLLPVMGRHDQVIFVVHSMGGLVAAQTLLSIASEMHNRDLTRRVKAVLFFGTPGTGSALATAASKVTMNVQVEELRGGEAVSTLVAAWNKFGRFQNLSLCLAESEPIGNWAVRWLVAPALKLVGADSGLVVGQQSAFALCGGRGTTISSVDHLGMVKPNNTQHGAYQQLFRRAYACARPATRGTNPGSLAGKPEATLARLWRERLRAALTASNRDAMERQVGRFVARRASDNAPLDVYVLPPEPTAAPRSYQLGEIGHGQFLVALMDQPIVSSEQTQREVSLVKNIDSITFDGGVRERVRQLRAGGQLSDDDLAVLVDDPNSSEGDFLVLFLQAGLPTDEALKGYLRIDGQPACSQVTAAAL